MTQHYFAGRVYGDICVRQPLAEAQAAQFILQSGETEDMEIFYVMNGAFLVVSHTPGVLFIEDPDQSMGQLCVKLKGSDTFWSMDVISHSDFTRRMEILLRYADALVMQIRACVPIDSHSAYRQKISALMDMMVEKNVRSVEARQIKFIKLERQYGTYEQNVALGATA
jgi:hypothetical protein